MEQRGGFVFYRSFYEAIHSLPKRDRLVTYEAVIEYALNGTLPQLAGTPAAVFTLAKPNLDASRRKAESGRLGGLARSKGQAKPEQSPGEEKKEEEEKEKSKSEGEDPAPESRAGLLCGGAGGGGPEGRLSACGPPGEGGRAPEPGGGPALYGNEGSLTGGKKGNEGSSPPGEAAQLYARLTGGALSPRGRSELAAFEREMGLGACRRAMEIALDAGKPAWPYMRGVLRSWKELGVTGEADIDRLDRPGTRKAGRSGGKPSCSDFESPGAVAALRRQARELEAAMREKEELEW